MHNAQRLGSSCTVSLWPHLFSGRPFSVLRCTDRLDSWISNLELNFRFLVNRNPKCKILNSKLSLPSFIRVFFLQADAKISLQTVALKLTRSTSITERNKKRHRNILLLIFRSQDETAHSLSFVWPMERLLSTSSLWKSEYQLCILSSTSRIDHQPWPVQEAVNLLPSSHSRRIPKIKLVSRKKGKHSTMAKSRMTSY